MTDLSLRTGKYFIDTNTNRIHYEMMDGSDVSLDLKIFLDYVRDPYCKKTISDLFKSIHNDMIKNTPELLL